MKNIHDSRFLAAMVLVGAVSFAHSTPLHGHSISTVNVEARFLFIPQGFDNNDRTEAVIDGFLPNACYTAVAPFVEFDADRKEFNIQPRAELVEGRDVVCGTFEVPYTQTAVLGAVEPGTYHVSADGTESKQLIITRSFTSEPDDYMYAPVDRVEVEVELNPRHITAYITGRYNNTCMRWQETKVIDQGDTVVIQPIVRLESRDDCQVTDIAYKGLKAEIPWRGPGRYLLHTRGLNGVAKNNVFSVHGE